MFSTVIIICLCLECLTLYAQFTRDQNRRLDHLERRYELHSSIANENFRDLWNHINHQNEKCCPLETKQTDGSQNKKLETDSMNLAEYGKSDEKMNLLTKAFSDEKKTMREMLESIQTTLEMYNKSCETAIKRLQTETGQINDEQCTCSSKWIKIYENDPEGKTIFGDRNDLIQAALSGSPVKILANKDYMTTVQNFRPVSGHLMAQALFHISITGDQFQDDAYWWFVTASTTGHWYMSRYNVGEHKSRGDNEIKYGMEWFIRRPCEMKSIARILSDGTVASGRVKNVVSAVRNGYSIRATSLKTGYTFPADNLEVYNDHVAAQSLWHLSQEFSADYKRTVFQKNAYWYFTIWSTNSKKDMSRWTVGKHESRGRSTDSSSLDWFADPCWKLVFRHSKEGVKIEGEKAHLIDAVRYGHRVRILYNDIAFEPNVVSITNGDVYALSMDSLSKTSFDEFEEDLAWIWRSVSTDGHVQTMKTPVGDSSNTFIYDKLSITWFVDKRNWKTLNSYDIESLSNVVRKGADVRLQFGNPQNDDVFYLQPDNLYAPTSNNNLAAMHVRQASFIPNIVPAWVFTYTSTKHKGFIDKAIWTLGKHSKVSHTQDHAPVVWFISE